MINLMIGTVCITLGLLITIASAVRIFQNSRGRPASDLSALATVVTQMDRTWPAAERGECPICGHAWIPGEIVGTVTNAYELRDDGTVLRSPGVRVVDILCWEKTQREGDLSLRWARESGMLP